MKYKGVLFDLDGTLLDTAEDIADAVNAALKKSGFPTHDTATCMTFVGSGVLKLLERALPEDNQDNETIEKCLADFTEFYNENCTKKTTYYKGVDIMLNALVEKGIKISILSNKPEDLTKLTVKELLADWQFELVVGANAQYPKKPDPTAARAIAKEMGLSMDEILYVGDSDIDMQTANAAGMFAVGVTWGFRTAEVLKDNGAKCLINKPEELLDLI